MELDFFDFAKFLFDTHFSEDIKLKDYIENTYKPTDIILYLKYSNYKKLSSNYLLMNLIYDLYNDIYGDVLQAMGVSSLGDFLQNGLYRENDFYDMIVSDIKGENILEIIFSEQKILADFRNFLLLNPIKTLSYIESFFVDIANSILKECKEFNIALITKDINLSNEENSFPTEKYINPNKKALPFIIADTLLTCSCLFEEHILSNNTYKTHFSVEVCSDKIVFKLNDVKVYMYTLKVDSAYIIRNAIDKNTFFYKDIIRLLKGCFIGDIPIELFTLYAEEISKLDSDFSYSNPSNLISDIFIQSIRNKYGLEFASFINQINKFDRPDLLLQEIVADMLCNDDIIYNTLGFIYNIHMQSRIHQL